MPKARSKHEAIGVLTFDDFTGGEVYGVSPESLQNNQLQLLKNWEFESVTSQPKVVYPFEVFCDIGAEITSIFCNYHDGYFLVACGQTLKKVVLTTGEVIDIEGTLSGAEPPSFAMWGQSPRVVLIASGGKLQSFDGSTLTDVDTSPDCDIVFVRAPAGRVVVAKKGDDTLYYSAVGDYTNWTDDPQDDSSAKSINVGYKDSGDIIAIQPMPSDIVVFKTSGRIFRVKGEFPDWAIVETQSMEHVISKDCVVRVSNDVVYMTKSGLKELSVTEKYGDILQSPLAENVNRYLAKSSTSAAKIWHIPSRNQIYVNPNGSNVCWILHLGIGERQAWSHVVFDFNVNFVLDVGGRIYLAGADKLYIQSDFPGQLQASMKLKRYIFDHDVIVKRVILYLQPDTVSHGAFMIGRYAIPFSTSAMGDVAYDDSDVAYSDADPIYTLGETAIERRVNIRTRSIEPEVIITEGSASIRKITIVYAEV
jgi:hypothetical protein